MFLDKPNKLNVYAQPTNIIAVSTSPFDKFPLERYRQTIDNYHYLGLRNLRALDLGKAYMASVFTALVISAFKKQWAGEKISDVLNYLGYEGVLEGRYHLEISPNKMRGVLESNNPIEKFIEEFLIDTNRLARRVSRRYFLDGDDISQQKVKDFLYFYKNIISRFDKPRVNIYISSDGVESKELTYLRDEFEVLVNSGVMKLRDILMHKKETKAPFMISDASSGEQSVVMSILGIASKIEDGSLICIDEPEVCLHPQWQEKYIELLISTFKEFKSCQFIIATHSPLIVSKLDDNNCFLMSMEDGELKPASDINNRSVDFQLANTFKTPGFKNEFLTRVLISHLASYSETGSLSDEAIIEIKSILELRDFVSDADPVKKLMAMIEEVIEEVC